MGRIAILCLGLIFTGCVRRTGRNTDCNWPGEFPLSDPTEHHLSADAEFAEDLAIRYTDTHLGPRTRQFESMAAYREGTQRCASTLYEAVAAMHHVPVASVQNALGKNRMLIDLAEITSFLLFYALASIIAIRRIQSLHPGGDASAHSLALTLYCSFAFAAAGLLGLDEWAEMMESIRVGTGHMSYRGFRLPCSHHHNFIFCALLALFWIIALTQGTYALRPGQGRVS